MKGFSFLFSQKSLHRSSSKKFKKLVYQNSVFQQTNMQFATKLESEASLSNSCSQPNILTLFMMESTSDEGKWSLFDSKNLLDNS